MFSGELTQDVVDLLSQGVPVLLRLFVFLGLYRWVPVSDVDWIEAFWGAILATLD